MFYLFALVHVVPCHDDQTHIDTFQVVREQSSLMKAFWLLSVILPSYVGYESWSLLTLTMTDSADHTLTFNIVITGISFVCMRLLLLYHSYRVHANFGPGLKTKLFDKQWAAVANYKSESL